MMTPNNTSTSEPTPANVPSSKANKKRSTKGGKKKDAAENAPIFLRSKFCRYLFVLEPL
jgi:hypothetical protein